MVASSWAIQLLKNKVKWCCVVSISQFSSSIRPPSSLPKTVGKKQVEFKMEGGSGDRAVEVYILWKLGLFNISMHIWSIYMNIHAKKTESGGVTTWGVKNKSWKRAELGEKNTNYIYGRKRCVEEGGFSGFRCTQVEEQWRSDLGRSTS